jgi:hypothetical protein
MSGDIEFHPRLVEESVWAAMRDHCGREEFHRQREALYELADAEARERAFTELNASWFRRLGLGGPFRQALIEQRDVSGRVGRILAEPASVPGREGADLFVAGRDERTVVISIRPESVLHPERLLDFLRSELLHVADMLDPSFGYSPRLPSHPGGPAHDRLLRERYRMLWECSVDARLLERGLLPRTSRERRLGDFARVFACLGERTGECFERVLAASRPSHAELVTLASHPQRAFGLGEDASTGPGRCPLCSSPTWRFEPEPDRLPRAILAEIRADFPTWSAKRGLCLQCADLYRSSSISAAAAEELPGCPSGAKRGGGRGPRVRHRGLS